jgi:dolichol-phosphate mannosyltransferase
MKLSFVIPCYNEADNIDKLRRELLPVVHSLINTDAIPTERCEAAEVVFVDDGSQDATLAALQAAFGNLGEPYLAVQIVVHPENRGLGAALRTGLRAATGDVLVTTDSDGTYAFRTIPLLLEYLGLHVDIVTASPYHPAGGVDNVPGYRLVLSQGSSLIYRVLVDRHLHTYTALFRAYRRSVIEHVMHEADGFLGGTELLVRAMFAGYRVAEFPTILHSRAYGVSKTKLWKTTQTHLQFQACVLAYRLGMRPWAERFAVVGERS